MIRMAVTLLYATFPSMQSARKAVSGLLGKNLIACANFFMSESHYKWKGRKVKEKECIAFIKTTPAKSILARAEILKMHPYKIPCVLGFPAKANKSYEKWVFSQCRVSKN